MLGLIAGYLPVAVSGADLLASGFWGNVKKEVLFITCK
jgi:hypothetical protein